MMLDRARIASANTFPDGTGIGRCWTEQRDSLTLQGRTHQGPVRTAVLVRSAVLKERDEAGRHGGELLRTDVHVRHVIPGLQVRVLAQAGVHQILGDLLDLVELHVRLRKGRSSRSAGIRERSSDRRLLQGALRLEWRPKETVHGT